MIREYSCVIAMTDITIGISGSADTSIPFTMKKTSLEERTIPLGDIKTDPAGKEEKEKTIICIFCGHVITFPDCIIEVNGSHLHTFRNPGGVVYRIGCFSGAVGCFDVSEPTVDFTWFPGFSWSISVCAHCKMHMGWNYRRDTGGFYGLILKNLTQNP